MNTTIAPVRPWTCPREGEDLQSIARREFPERPLEEAVADLQSWNLYLVFRPAPAALTPSDIVFTGPPAA